MEDGDILPWSKNNLLHWSDFTAEPNPAAFEDSSSSIKYYHTWTVHSEMSGDKIYFLIDEVKLTTNFFRHLSWFRPQYASENLLKHEQGHFDLAESFRLEITEKISNKFKNKKFPTRGQNEEQRKQFAREDSGLMLSKELATYAEILMEKRTKYDEETEFGQNLIAQKKYDDALSYLRE